MSATVVIGANFGDEGKGLMTDHFTSVKTDGHHLHRPPLTIRFNGGAQAGHTVVCPDSGRRHVFSHFGSGTLLGSPTFLAKRFVVSPRLFVKEMLELGTLEVKVPNVYVHPDCIVSTPYDVLINRAVESSRGTVRHGSCGVGFGEAIERSLNPDLRIRYADLANPRSLREKLDLIRNEYVTARLETLKTGPVSSDITALLAEDGLIVRFLEDTKILFYKSMCRTETVVDDFTDHVFEGAQGLLLDQDHGVMPHCTRSNTGLKNVMEIVNASRTIRELEAVYVTRTYLTRHGAGPLKNELFAPPYAHVVDETNIENKFQGHLRFAHHDLNSLAAAILKDVSDHVGGWGSHRIALTCCDQLGYAPISYYKDNVKRTEALHKFVNELVYRSRAENTVYTSWGPTRRTVKTELTELCKAVCCG